MEVKTFVCPNCGANTTNTQNCEYCGSLLVRFVERGIDLSHTTYTSNEAVFPGLVQELKRNLKLQEENPNIVVATDLLKEKANGDCECVNIMDGIRWEDGTVFPEFDGSKRGLCIALGFDTYTDVASYKYKEYNDRKDAQLAKFRQLDSFPLFTSHNYAFVDEGGCSRFRRLYAINFGEDAEGAARLVSEILIKVKDWSPTEPYDMFTNVGDNIDRARNAWDEAHGFQTASDNTGCGGMMIALIITIGLTLYSILGL